MRGAFRRRRDEEEEESVFISMTDMTVGFLFIVIILLAFFATQIAPGETVPKALLDERDREVVTLREQLLSPTNHLHQKILQLRSEIDRLMRRSETENPITRYNILAASELDTMLTRIQEKVEASDEKIVVGISRNRDALQFRGDGLFASGESTPSELGRAKMRVIARILREEIGCYTYNSPRAVDAACNPDAVTIDAIQIEGHTDSVGEDIRNMLLGVQRGAAIYEVMISQANDLLNYRNIEGRPVLSVAGYGEGRPISNEALPGGKDANRRIDIRFIMYAPAKEAAIPLDVDDLVRVRDLLGAGAAR